MRSYGVFGMGWVVASLVATSAAAAPQFEAVDGYVVMEAESVAPAMHWETETPADAMGEKARGDVPYFNDPNASICSTNKNTAEGFPAMEYRFGVHQAGVYWVKMNVRKQVHCVSEGNDGDACHSGAGCQSMGIQSEGDSCNGPNQCWRSDISNDAFVAMETDDGQGVPYIGGHTDIMKFFGGKAGEYGWSGNRALDHNAPTYQLEAGDYVFKVRGRSRGLKIDRIIVFHEDADEQTAKSAPETPFVDPGTGGGGGTTTGAGATAGSGAGSPGEATGSGGEKASTGGNSADDATEADGSCSLSRSGGDGGYAPWLLLAASALLRRRRRGA